MCVCVCVCTSISLLTPNHFKFQLNYNFSQFDRCLLVVGGAPTVVIRIGNRTATIALDGDAWQSHDRHCGLYAPSKGRLVIAHDMA